jgi:hypothetical protein
MAAIDHFATEFPRSVVDASPVVPVDFDPDALSFISIQAEGDDRARRGSYTMGGVLCSS